MYSTLYDKYFDMANIKYYDVILGTPFQRKHNIVLDFSSPGNIFMGNELIPTIKQPSMTRYQRRAAIQK